MDATSALESALAVADWRRRIADLYAAIRNTVDPAEAHGLWRRERNTLFRTHPASPIPPPDRARFVGLPCPDYDPAWRFCVDLDGDGAGADETWDLGMDGALRIAPIARTVGLEASLGDELTLWRLGGYGGGLFLPVRDGSNGTDSFGGGRYVLDTIKGADLGTHGGRLIVDFNFSYAPSCAHDPVWTCPLAPAGNTVPATIPVGERTVPVSPAGAHPPQA